MSSSSSSSSKEEKKDSSEKTQTKPPQVPHYPSDYVVPEVWTFQEPQLGVVGGMNRPTAGPRRDQKLPRGRHNIQLYSLGTPNGVKVTILLEELYDIYGLEYDAWTINIFDLDQFGSEFCAMNPNSKIPALLDYAHDPPLRVFESGNILQYLTETYDPNGIFLPPATATRQRVECFNWLYWQMASAPYVGGGFGHFFVYAPLKIEYAIDRFTMETKRQLDVLNGHLAHHTYMVDRNVGINNRDDNDKTENDEDETSSLGPSIADFAIWPWIMCLDKYYRAGTFLQLRESYPHLMRWFDLLQDRSALKRGLRVNGFGPDAVKERHSREDFDSNNEGNSIGKEN